MLSRVCNCEDQYAIVHASSNMLKPHMTLLIFVMGINSPRKVVTSNLFSQRKASSKYL